MRTYQEYQPTNPDLLNYAVELLENGTIDGIKCCLSDDNDHLVAEMKINNEIKKVGSVVSYPLDDRNKQLAYLEKQLLEDIKVTFLLNKIESVIKEILSTEQGRKRFAELLEQDNP